MKSFLSRLTGTSPDKICGRTRLPRRDLMDLIIRYCDQARRGFVLGLVVERRGAEVDLRRSLREDHAPVVVIKAVWRGVPAFGYGGARIVAGVDFA